MKSFHYQEIQPERDVTGDNFANGQINFNWTLDSVGYWNPYRTFIRIRCALYKRTAGTDSKLVESDQIAPNMFLADNLFQSLKMQINNKTVSEIGDYVPQVSALKHRMYKTEEEMNNFVSTCNFSQSSFKERQQKIIDPTESGSLLQYTYTDQVEPTSYIVKNTAEGYLRVSQNQHTQVTVGDVLLLSNGQVKTINDKTINTTPDPDVYQLVVDSNDGTDFQVEAEVTYQIRKAAKVLSTNLQTDNDSGFNREVQEFEILWRPCLGMFEIDNFIPGTQGLFNLQLTPHPSQIYPKMAVENLGSLSAISGSNTTDTGYVFSIRSMNMYLLKGIGEPAMNKTLSLSFKEIRCQAQNLTTESLHQKTFQVHPRTQELTLAYQYPGAGLTGTGYTASKFVGHLAQNNTISDEKLLQRFWVRFGGKQLPTPIPDPTFDDSGTLLKDYYTQRWLESVMYANALRSPEPYEKWLERGVYFHFSGYGDYEKEDRCYVSQQFSSHNDTSLRPHVLLFDHFTKNVTINIRDSQLYNVQIA